VLVFTGKELNDSWNSVEGSFTLAGPDSIPPAAPTNLQVRPASDPARRE
jgi:hypothetical protein